MSHRYWYTYYYLYYGYTIYCVNEFKATSLDFEMIMALVLMVERVLLNKYTNTVASYNFSKT